MTDDQRWLTYFLTLNKLIKSDIPTTKPNGTYNVLCGNGNHTGCWQQQPYGLKAVKFQRLTPLRLEVAYPVILQPILDAKSFSRGANVDYYNLESKIIDGIQNQLGQLRQVFCCIPLMRSNQAGLWLKAGVAVNSNSLPCRTPQILMVKWI